MVLFGAAKSALLCGPAAEVLRRMQSFEAGDVQRAAVVHAGERSAAGGCVNGGRVHSRIWRGTYKRVGSSVVKSRSRGGFVWWTRPMRL